MRGIDTAYDIYLEQRNIDAPILTKEDYSVRFMLIMSSKITNELYKILPLSGINTAFRETPFKRYDVVKIIKDVEFEGTREHCDLTLDREIVTYFDGNEQIDAVAHRIFSRLLKIERFDKFDSFACICHVTPCGDSGLHDFCVTTTYGILYKPINILQDI